MKYWYLIHSKPRDEIISGNLNMIGNEVYFTISHDIYRYVNGNFQKQLSISAPSFNYLVSGLSIKDIFIFMLDGLAHYNGSNIEYLYRLPQSNRLWIGSMIFKNEVFFNVYDLANRNNYILRGKLKE